jgi:hypothetical protein
MSNFNTLDPVQTLPDPSTTRTEKNKTVSFLADFASIKHLLVEARAPSRPSRCHPIPLDEELARLTPSNARLLELAAQHPPPKEWYDEDEERPF